MRGIQSDERRARHAKHRLEVARYELPVVLIHLVAIPEAEWRLPPHDVVIAGDNYRTAYLLRVTNENSGALELTGTRALREISRNGDYVELLALDCILDRIDLRRDGRPAEVKIRDVKDSRHWMSCYCAITMSASFEAMSRASSLNPNGVKASAATCAS